MIDREFNYPISHNPVGFISPYLEIWPSFNPPLAIGILASGEGSNFEAIIKSINSNKLTAEIKLLIVNNHKCKAIEKAKKYKIPFSVVDQNKYPDRHSFDLEITNKFKSYNIEGIIMAGWMRIVGDHIIKVFENRIINIHPSILPSFKGINSIKQSLDNNSLITGCSTHYVVNEVDSGKLIAQAALPILYDDDQISLRNRIRYFEHKILPMSIAIAGRQWRSI